MKIIAAILSILLTVSCAEGKENTYTGSTPADRIVRSFLEIPMADSVEFIRWQLTLGNDHYTLHCNYGISKPNTNGFMEGGRKMELSGSFKKEKNVYQLKESDRVLKLMELNTDLLHILDADNNLLVGNGGWSYALSNVTPTVTDQINITAKQTILKDSMVFEGRTPCGVPGIIPPGMLCYKLKWYLILYGNAKNNEPAGYKVYGTPYRKEGGRTGDWKINTQKNGNIIYQLNDDNGKGFIYLLKADEHILLFTDESGRLLAGNEDFAFTLNRHSNN
ncbi:MAG: hypothetical protein ABI861_13525 [Panacibacter sp.]